MVPRRRARRATSRAAACAGSRASSRRRTSSASAPGRSTCWRAAGSSARRRARSPSRCRRLPRGPRRSSCAPAPSSASSRSPSRSRSPATSASSASTTAGSSRSAAGSSTSSRPPAASRCASSSSATRSSRSAPSPPSRSARCTPSPRPSSIPPPSGASTSSTRRRSGVPDDLVPPLDRVPDLVFQPDEVRRVWDEEGLVAQPSLEGATELDPFPQAQPFAFEAQRPAIAARGLAEAENELAAFVRAGQRVVVAFPHRGEALRTQNLLRRVEARVLEPGEPLPAEAEVLFAIAPARRGFVWRDLGLVLLPDHQVFRRRVPRERRIGGRALQSFADLRTGRLRRPRGPRRRQAARLRDEGGRGRHARLPPARVPRRRPPLRPARAARQGLALHRRRREGARALEARRQGVAAAQVAGARVGAGARGRADRAVRAAADAAGHRVRPEPRVDRAARGVVPVPRDAGPGGRRSRPSRRTSRRRTRWTASSAATSASARPRSRCAPRSRSRSTASRC